MTAFTLLVFFVSFSSFLHLLNRLCLELQVFLTFALLVLSPMPLGWGESVGVWVGA